MKKAVLAALCGILLLTGSAFAQSGGTNISQRNGYWFNNQTGQQTDANGNALISNINDGSWALFPGIINNQLSASGAGMADSSVVFDTHAYGRINLLFTPQFDSLSNVVRIAVQVRGHYNLAADSSSTFPWHRWANHSLAAASQVDSIGQFIEYTRPPDTQVQATAATSIGTGVWPSEFIVKFNYAQGDTTGTANGKPGGYPKTQMVTLVDSNGAPYWAPYTSVRVRVINGVRSRFRLKVDAVAGGR